MNIFRVSKTVTPNAPLSEVLIYCFSKQQKKWQCLTGFEPQTSSSFRTNCSANSASPWVTPTHTFYGVSNPIFK